MSRCNDNRRNERGSAYIAVVIIISVLFIWITFQLDRLIQNEQTIQYDTRILQAQYVAESGIEQMRLILRDQPVHNETVSVTLETGTAKTEVISTDPLRIRSIGRVEPNIQQTITVELDPETLQILTWSRKKQPD